MWLLDEQIQVRCYGKQNHTATCLKFLQVLVTAWQKHTPYIHIYIFVALTHPSQTSVTASLVTSINYFCE